MKEDSSLNNDGKIKKGSRLRKQRLLSKLPPSHPDFDRSKFSVEEFIELLLFENRELQSALSAIEDKAKQLEPENDSLDSKSEGVITVDDVPQRSARRRKEVDQSQDSEAKGALDFKQDRRTSDASITSNGPINIIGGVPISSKFKPELAASAGLSTSPEKELPKSPSVTLGDSTLGPSASSETEASPFGPKEKENKEDSKASSPKLDDVRDETGISMTRKARQDSLGTEGSYKSRIKLPSGMRNAQNESSNDSFHTHDNKGVALSKLNTHQEDSTSQDTTSSLSKDQKAQDNAPGTPDQMHLPQEKLSAISVSNSNGSRSYFDSPNTISSLAYTPNAKVRAGYFGNFQGSAESLPSSLKPSVQSPGSSFNVLNTSVDQEEEDIPLFIQPEDFQTIKIVVVSTINVNAKKSDNINCTFSINDRESNKEMWRVRKSYSEMINFDNEIRPVVEFFGLPSIPEKSTFNATTPTKVDSRMKALQDYFDTIFAMPHIPHIVLYRICRYISLGFVSPLDDFKSGAKKEGFLIRRYKGLGTTWKIRWCSIDGPALEIYEFPGGSLIEQIKLAGSQIGRQSSDIVAEERGYRHAFLILESSKSSKISGSYPKHFFCAESDVERDEWISAMVEFTENDPLANNFQTVPSAIEPTMEISPIKSENHHENADSTGRKLKHLSSASSIPSEDLQQQLPQEEPLSKEGKKMKMRSLFAFRNKASHTEGGLIQEAPPNSYLPESSMQTYLDQLNLSDAQAKAVFGRDLKVAFELSNHNYKGLNIPSVCFRCLEFLTKSGAIYEEGIFRLSGSASTIRQLKEKFNQDFDVNLFESSLRPDIHTVAGLFKTYLRELPHPIFGIDAYFELQKVVTESSNAKVPQSRVSLRIRDLLQNSNLMDRVNYDTCIAIFGFLRSVISQSSMNRMSLKNVCIVFVPTLNVSVEVLSLFLIDFDCIFGNSPPTRDSNREVLDLQIPTF